MKQKMNFEIQSVLFSNSTGIQCRNHITARAGAPETPWTISYLDTIVVVRQFAATLEEAEQKAAFVQKRANSAVFRCPRRQHVPVLQQLYLDWEKENGK
jgi:hypothetical protein